MTSKYTNHVRDDDAFCSVLAKSDVGGYLYEAEYVPLIKLQQQRRRLTVSDSEAGGRIQGTCLL